MFTDLQLKNSGHMKISRSMSPSLYAHKLTSVPFFIYDKCLGVEKLNNFFSPQCEDTVAFL